MKSSKAASTRRQPKASTHDILGGPRSATDRVPAKWKRHYKALSDLRDHFIRRQCDLTRDATEEIPSFSTHMADAGTDAYDRDLALGMLSSEQDALYQIEQALDRIRQRTYGICELTGRPIEPARLLAIPWTRFSIDAECRLEREGRRKRTSLGRRETVIKTDPGTSLGDEEPDAL